MSGYDLGAAQFGAAPSEDEEDAETPVNSDEPEQRNRSGFGQVGSALHDTFGGAGQYSGGLHPALSSTQFTSGGGSAGGSFGGAQHEAAVPPGLSAAAETQNMHGRDAAASLRGRYASQNGRSQNDVARQFGSPGQ
jgi:hypothetical protein